MRWAGGRPRLEDMHGRPQFARLCHVVGERDKIAEMRLASTRTKCFSLEAR